MLQMSLHKFSDLEIVPIWTTAIVALSNICSDNSSIVGKYI